MVGHAHHRYRIVKTVRATAVIVDTFSDSGKFLASPHHEDD